MGFAQSIPAALIEEFKKSLLRPKVPEAAQPGLSRPTDLASARLQPEVREGEPDAERFLRTSEMARMAPPMSEPVNPGMAEMPRPQQPADLAQMRLQEPPAPSRFTPRPEYHAEHKPGEPIGLGQRILHALKGAGLGALEGMQHGGLMGAVGGAAAGGIGAGASPENLHKLQYQSRTLPMWRQRVGDEIEIGKAEQGAQESQARIQNYNTDNDLAARRVSASEETNRINQGLRYDSAAALERERLRQDEDRNLNREQQKQLAADRASGTTMQKAEHELREREFAWKQEHGQDLTPNEQRTHSRQDRQDAEKHIKAVQDADAEVESAHSEAEKVRQALSHAKPGEPAYYYGGAKSGDHAAIPVDEGTLAAAVAKEDAARSKRAAAQGAAETSGLVDIDAADSGGKRNVKPRAQSAAPAQRGRAQTITAAERDAQVAKHGQEAVDRWLKEKGITVQ